MTIEFETDLEKVYSLHGQDLSQEQIEELMAKDGKKHDNKHHAGQASHKRRLDAALSSLVEGVNRFIETHERK